MDKKFVFGTVTVPTGQRGPWKIDDVTLDDKKDIGFWMENARALRDNPIMYCRPGTYRRLVHKKRGVVMSNTTMERRTAIDAYIHATGCVLVNGLGLGMVLEGILNRDRVTHVTVVEIDPDLCVLVGDYFKAKDKRVAIVNDDAYTFKPPYGAHYDYVWHDIWDDISESNLPQMAKLTRKYRKPLSERQGVWSRDVVRAMQARERRSGW